MSTQGKATPDQWAMQHTAGHETHGQSAVYDMRTGKDVAIVYDGAKHARLIAAAPALLEAAKDFIAYLERFWPDEPLFGDRDNAAEDLNKLRDAIAQAEGQA